MIQSVATRLTRRRVIAQLGAVAACMGGALAACSTAPKTAPPRVRRIGYLSNANAAADPTQNTPSLSRELKALGYGEGQDLVIEARLSEGIRDRLPGLAAELVALNVDLIVTTGGTQSARAAKDATSSIPIVFTGLEDPVRFGLVSNLGRPGENLTGVVTEDFTAKRVQLLKESVPKLRSIAVLVNETDSGAVAAKQSVQEAAKALGLASIAIPLTAPTELERALEAIARARPDGLVDTHGMQFYGRGFADLGKLLDFAVRHRLPQTYNGVDYARAGGLMAVGDDIAARWKRVAGIVDRILRGEDPGTIPVEVSPAFELALNLSMARKLDMTFPESVLRQATEVIQ